MGRPGTPDERSPFPGGRRPQEGKFRRVTPGWRGRVGGGAPMAHTNGEFEGCPPRRASRRLHVLGVGLTAPPFLASKTEPDQGRGAAQPSQGRKRKPKPRKRNRDPNGPRAPRRFTRGTGRPHHFVTVGQGKNIMGLHHLCDSWMKSIPHNIKTIILRVTRNVHLHN